MGKIRAVFIDLNLTLANKDLCDFIWYFAIPRAINGIYGHKFETVIDIVTYSYFYESPEYPWDPHWFLIPFWMHVFGLWKEEKEKETEEFFKRFIRVVPVIYKRFHKKFFENFEGYVIPDFEDKFVEEYFQRRKSEARSICEEYLEECKRDPESNKYFKKIERIIYTNAGIDLSKVGENLVTTMEPWSTLESILRKVRKKFEVVFVISNIDPLMFKYHRSVVEELEKIGIKVFCPIVEMKIAKSPLFFEKFLDKLGYDPLEAVMIGDSLTSDYKAAKEVGMNAILYDKIGKYEEGVVSEYARSWEEVWRILQKM